MNNVLSIILGGGAGTRLYPLTKTRAKPAVPLAGKHRLIDIPISNCINSNLLKIYVLTQFNSASLNQHISRSYNFSGFQQGFVEILAAQQTPENMNWFQGTADAVRQYLWLFDRAEADEYLILSGDHLYRMDYRDFIQHHRKTNADITLSVLPVDEKQASSFGLMKIDNTGRIIDFQEKPKGDDLKRMEVDTKTLGLSAQEAKMKPYIASMGIYLFKREVLIDLLKQQPDCTDFGKEIIPNAIKDLNIQAYLFNDYWEDIGTIEAFFNANLALAKQPNPSFSFYDKAAPIYTRARYLPPTKQLKCEVIQSMISEGCVLKDCYIENSVIGIRSRIDSGCTIKNVLLMGADYYQSDFENEGDCSLENIPIGIGSNTTIDHAIIDKNARIGCNVKIINKDNVSEAEKEDQGFYIRSNIITVVKDAVIPHDTVI
ncbi:glucose-1-phosphate adenylyltransferase [Crocosphaera subtropica ATCC 51142]|uniref:Glucose-1-phosphate adenylyltransferase n=1 Tax=Crocosphaera subtropica (strain ATCC 51142 / BH68) TaxID=43989 RepID=B1WT84_CROS5|nr:glucose-1-phosphate adenylyltransferase [Crocosphaera subtropica]ACB52006.1 glucose-1-phosphate adenylyltransferase [Crocosphaera subtropica ATCC 51142]